MRGGRRCRAGEDVGVRERVAQPTGVGCCSAKLRARYGSGARDDILQHSNATAYETDSFGEDWGMGRGTGYLTTLCGWGWVGDANSLELRDVSKGAGGGTRTHGLRFTKTQRPRLGCLFQSPICTASAFVVRRGLLQARSVCRPCCQNCCQARLLRHALVTTS